MLDIFVLVVDIISVLFDEVSGFGFLQVFAFGNALLGFSLTSCLTQFFQHFGI